MGQAIFSASIVITSAIVLIHQRILRLTWLDPVVIATLGFLCSGIFLLSHFVVYIHGGTYDSTFLPTTTMYFIVAILAWHVGGLTGWWFARRGPRPATAPLAGDPDRRPIPLWLDDSPLFVTFLYGFSILFIAVSMFDLLDAVSALKSFTLTALRKLAILDTMKGNQDFQPESALKAILRSGFLLWTTTVIVRWSLNRRVSIASIIVFFWGSLSIMLSGLSTGKRSGIALMVALFGLSFWLAKAVARASAYPHGCSFQVALPTLRLRRAWSFAAAALAVLYALFVVFPMARNPNAIYAAEKFLNLTHPARFGPPVYWLAENAGIPQAPVAAYGLAYFTHGLVKAAYFLEKPTILPPKQHGFYNGKAIIRLISLIEPKLYQKWENIRIQLAAAFARNNMSTNPWKSLIGDLILDFDPSITIFMIFIISLSSEYLFRIFLNMRSIKFFPIAVFFSLFSLSVPFFGGFVNNFIMYPIILWIAIFFLNDVCLEAIGRRRSFRGRPYSRQ